LGRQGWFASSAGFIDHPPGTFRQEVIPMSGDRDRPPLQKAILDGKITVA
jgi:hypothetical protein